MKSQSLREAQAEAVSERLLDAAMASIEAGDAPTMRGVAKAAGVSERTIYRYFPSHDDLVEALRPRFVGRAGIPLCAHADDLEAYVADLYATFEANRKLVTTLNRSAWAAPPLEASRERNLRALRALLANAHPHADPAALDAAAATLRLQMAGAGWLYLRTAGDPDPEALVAQVQWSIRTLRAALDA